MTNKPNKSFTANENNVYTTDLIFTKRTYSLQDNTEFAPPTYLTTPAYYGLLISDPAKLAIYRLLQQSSFGEPNAYLVADDTVYVQGTPGLQPIPGIENKNFESTIWPVDKISNIKIDIKPFLTDVIASDNIVYGPIVNKYYEQVCRRTSPDEHIGNYFSVPVIRSAYEKFKTQRPVEFSELNRKFNGRFDLVYNYLIDVETRGNTQAIAKQGEFSVGALQVNLEAHYGKSVLQPLISALKRVSNNQVKTDSLLELKKATITYINNKEVQEAAIISGLLVLHDKLKNQRITNCRELIVALLSYAGSPKYICDNRNFAGYCRRINKTITVAKQIFKSGCPVDANEFCSNS